MNYIVELIIRPARNLYQQRDLGAKVFYYVGQMFKRTDFETQIKNKRGNKITCSFWSPNEMNSKELSIVLILNNKSHLVLFIVMEMEEIKLIL